MMNLVEFRFAGVADREEAIYELLLQISDRLVKVETVLAKLGRDVNDIERDMVVEMDLESVMVTEDMLD